VLSWCLPRPFKAVLKDLQRGGCITMASGINAVNYDPESSQQKGRPERRLSVRGKGESSLGSPRAMTLVAQLCESRIQHDIGAKALAEIEADIAVSEREISDMKGRKNDAILSVMKEASAGFVADLAILADDLRQLLVTLPAVDRLTARSTGDWSPTERVVVTLPSVGGVPEQVVVAPNSAIEKAKTIWAGFAAELSPHVIGNEDDGKTTYAELSRVERQAIDLAHASGVK
jgi:hypothetical protein